MPLLKPSLIKKVKRFRAERGGEFYSMRNFFDDHRIMYETIVSSTPQQNGVERKHSHILSVARALRFQSHLPLAIWGESVLTSVYLISRIPTPLLSRRIPFEVLHNKPPTYHHL